MYSYMSVNSELWETIATRPNKNTFKTQHNDCPSGVFTSHDSCSVRNKALFMFVSPKASSCSSRYTASLCAIRFLPYTPWLRRMGASYVHRATTVVVRACDYAVGKVLNLATIILIQFINFRQGAPPPFLYPSRDSRHAGLLSDSLPPTAWKNNCVFFFSRIHASLKLFTCFSYTCFIYICKVEAAQCEESCCIVDC